MSNDEKQKALNLEVGQAMFQKFKTDHIGIPNVSDAVYYTQQEADAYNALLTGALDSTTPLTAEQAAAYNEAITGASKQAGDTLSTAEANAYNATLDGAVSTTDIKTPAVPTKVKDYVDEGLAGKTDKLPMTGQGAATENNLMAIDANGNIKDSGIAKANVAEKDGYYPDLHAGIADNLFGETQTNDRFMFRPTAGIQDIESGEPPVGGGAVRKVEGYTVVWNQKNNATTPTLFAAHWIGYMSDNSTYPKDHKIFVRFKYNKTSAYTSSNVLCTLAHDGDTWGGNITFNVSNDSGSCSAILTSNNNSNSGIGLMYRDNSGSSASYGIGSLTASDINLIDLTLIFGSGNEPSTVAEFEQWLSLNIGLKDYYPYNAGELIPVKDYKVKSVGFNAFDKTKYNVSSTDYDYKYDAGGSAYYYCKRIRLLPNKAYCVHKPESVANYNCIILIGRTEQVNSDYFDTRHAAAQTRVYTTDDKGFLYIGIYSGSTASYQQRMSEIDLCISLSYDDEKDGTYEQHWEHETAIDVTKLYGKLNGSGDYVQVFPDGVKKAGSVADLVDLKNGVANKMVGKVNMDTAEFYDVESGMYEVRLPDVSVIKLSYNYLCPIYTNGLIFTNWADRSVLKEMQMGLYKVSVARFTVRDNSCANLAAFTSKIKATDIYYELATPLTYTDLIFRENGVDIPVSEIAYAVDDYGTEEVLLGNDEAVVNCAPTMTIKYGINAADTVASLPHTYVSSKYQSLNDTEQKTARANIGAASKNEVAVIRKQLEAIDKKVENDYYVDMGLPSGTLWAKRNIFTGTGNDRGFALSEYSYDADFFDWGNTDGHIPSGTAFDYAFDATSYTSTNGAKLTGNIPLSQDAARVNCGEPWRLPTREEYKELFANSDFIDASGNIIASSQANKLVTMNSCVGIRLKSKINGIILFFPCAGFGENAYLGGKGSIGNYIASTLINPTRGGILYFLNTNVYPASNADRSMGLTIRPVM